MKIEIRLEAPGFGTKEAVIVQWLADIGDIVTEEQPIIELISEQEMFSVFAPADGIIQDTFFRSGETVTVNDVLGIIETDMELFDKTIRR